MRADLPPWTDIAGEFSDGLVLGNGASIALEPRFSYKSLHGEAQRLGLITDDVQKVFDYLDTSDFEFVLRVLWHAENVNTALDVAEDKTTHAYQSVKDALIGVVREIHPAYRDVEERLTRAATFMGHFDTVVSLNYDVLVYWAMQCANRDAPNRFKDCFLGGELTADWERFRAPWPPNAKATLVFYPHGNLVLGADITGVERKVHTRWLSNLLESVFEAWQAEEVSPVFVSEGTSGQKRLSIRRSPYLTTVLDEVLPGLGESLVFHGWTMGAQDAHLMKAMRRGDVSRVAYGVDPEGPSLEKTQHRILERIARYFGGDLEVVFYNRRSSGCWISQ
jgi:hypothetical protein